MLEVHPLVYLVGLCAVLALFITAVAKALIKWRWDSEPKWHDLALRIASTLTGGFVGLAGLGAPSSIGLPWYLLLVIGLGAGSQATVVVETIKGVILPWRRSE